MTLYGTCEECYQKNTKYFWCSTCNAKHFQQNFKNWNSGNDDVNKFIQDSQLSAKESYNALEWIPYDRFYDIKYIAKALKSLNNSKNVTLGFINEITLHYKIIEFTGSTVVNLYGITQDPETKNYMMVLEYAEHGSLRNYLNNNDESNWKTKIYDLCYIAHGLYKIHENELIHRDLHIGNVLKLEYNACITDMGLCKPANYNTLTIENTEDSIYGVLPYIAPEILRGQKFTKAADIYSFGIIMYEVFSGLPPYYDVSHDKNLALKICQGFRPRFKIKVPQLIVHLIKRCLDANPLNRPTAKEIEVILSRWNHGTGELELSKQIKEAEEINNNSLTISLPSTNLALSYEKHSDAVYTSRLLNFNNLPEPKNSDDYYEQNDNIISMEFSESLQIDISYLKINDAEGI
ncbi:kinase-like domain-containing protein [Glomus cerebriforme]|uniref:Kinase-like domain-containing protein n=1 Tax=Glomus cerebriforme TaxID=658196 RepID=A0A397SDX9_9GLOM|nr:kinase-like domain-containing protein [Glomus cerebriforme]